MKRNRLLVTIAFVVASVACSSDVDDGVGGEHDSGADATASTDAEDASADAGPPEFEERPVAGQWLAGDFHVHATGASNDTGGDSTPERIKEVALQRGLDFLVLTDHSNSTGSDPTTTEEDPDLFNQGPEFPYWDKAAELSTEGFLMIDGNEMSPIAEGETPSEPTGHVGCYPRDLTTFDPDVAFTDRPRGDVTGAETLQQAHDAGCFATLNHPFGPASWISFDWTSRDYDAIEVYNGGGSWDQFDLRAVRGWACDLSLGERITAIAGSDNHRVNIDPPGSLFDPPLAWPVTYVWAEDLAWPQIIESLDTHRVTISDTGTPMELDVYDSTGGWLAMIGGEFSAGDAAWIRVRGELEDPREDEERLLQIARIVPDACDDLREEDSITPPVPNLEVVYEGTIELGESFDVAVPLDASAGEAFFAWMRPEKETVIQKNGVAVTNAIFAR